MADVDVHRITHRIIPFTIGLTLVVACILFLTGRIFPYRARVFAIADLPRTEEEEEDEEEALVRLYGSVACQASLFGLTRKERRRVMDRALSQNVTSFCQAAKERDGFGGASGEASQSQDDRVELGAMTPVNDDTCAICLKEYVNGVETTHGTSCTHLFHRSCAMEWLEKGKDYCPCCRREMITPAEMKAAAMDELDPSRIASLSVKPSSASTEP